jgi:sugar lactone lactonase YvrE
MFVDEQHGPSRRLLVADKDNRKISIWSKDGHQHIRNVAVQGHPRGICVDMNANIIVSSLNHTIQIYDPINFELLQVIGTREQKSNEPGRFYYPTGMCVDDENNLYVCDSENHRLQVF